MHSIVGVNCKIEFQSLAVTKNYNNGIYLGNLALINVKLTGCDVSRNEKHNLVLNKIH